MFELSLYFVFSVYGLEVRCFKVFYLRLSREQIVYISRVVFKKIFYPQKRRLKLEI
jgi:hypothetical protein